MGGRVTAAAAAALSCELPSNGKHIRVKKIELKIPAGSQVAGLGLG